MFNCLVVRNSSVDESSEVQAPEGYKFVTVFGVVAVPEDVAINGNHVLDVSPELVLNASTPLPAKYAMWEAPEVCRELFGLASMREHSVVKVLDRGLELIRDQKTADPELQGIATEVRALMGSMPIHDSMRTIMRAIVSIADEHKPVQPKE